METLKRGSRKERAVMLLQALLAELNEPLMSSTLLLPGDELPMIDPQPWSAQYRNFRSQ